MEKEEHHDEMSKGRSSLKAGRVESAMSVLAEHTVQKGETLSHIALHYYGSAVKDKWMVIYQKDRGWHR